MTVSLAMDVFSDKKWQEIQLLLKTLDARQVAWLSGYLAGQSNTDSETARPVINESEVLVAYGTETGNCEKLARQFEALARAENIKVVVCDLAYVRLRQLGKQTYVLFICSTHGDGDPPESVKSFYAALMDAKAPRLPNLRYAVLSLGDSTYEHFCATGKQLDERFASLGGTRLTFRQDCDVDYHSTAKLWMEDILKLIPHSEPSGSIAIQHVDQTEKITKSNPLLTTVLSNNRLSHCSRDNPVHHIELSIDSKRISLASGDAVGVLVRNPDTLVDAILEAANIKRDEVVTINHRTTRLDMVLAEECDLTIPSNKFIDMWSQAALSADLTEIANLEHTEKKSFLKKHQVLDIIKKFPAKVDAQHFVNHLRPLQPRLYDIANSINFIEDEVHLTVKKYTYGFQERIEEGVASAYLVNLKEDEQLRIYPYRNARFHLPEMLDVPLILIADSTGIAPYRSFIQEIQLGVRTHPCWLIFSEEQYEEDFLYQIELQKAMELDILKRIDTFFHHEESAGSLGKTVITQSGLLLDWLKQGAHIYLCGDKPRLTECENEITAWLSSSDKQEVSWQSLDSNHRIHRNLY
jgi:sulfite reductase (NADPH) flavoprotein alpha-component